MNIWLIYIWEQHLLVQKKNLKQTCDLRTVSLLHVWSLKCRALLHLEETCAVPSFRFIVSETWILLNFCSPFTSMFLEVRIECRKRNCVIHHPEMSFLPCKSWGKKKKKSNFLSMLNLWVGRSRTYWGSCDYENMWGTLSTFLDTLNACLSKLWLCRK